jgi:hypothetical protein
LDNTVRGELVEPRTRKMRDCCSSFDKLRTNGALSNCPIKVGLLLPLLGCDRFPQRQARGLVGIAGLRKADARAGIREDARHDRRQRRRDLPRQAKGARHGQILVILQPATKVCELHSGDRSRNAPVLVRVQFLLAWIDQDAVAVDIALIVDRLSRLAAVVEGD